MHVCMQAMSHAMKAHPGALGMRFEMLQLIGRLCRASKFKHEDGLSASGGKELAQRACAAALSADLLALVVSLLTTGSAEEPSAQQAAAIFLCNMTVLLDDKVRWWTPFAVGRPTNAMGSLPNLATRAILGLAGRSTRHVAIHCREARA